MPNPYHVRLAISQYGDNFRAELFTEDLGDTNGDLLPTQWDLLDDEFKGYLAMGAAGLPADMARKVGQEMFGYMLGKGENSKKWSEILGQARHQKRPVRLLVDASTDDVRDLPYGLLCDPDDNYYLVRPAEAQVPVQYVRILRRCTPRALLLDKPRLKILLAAAEPKRVSTFQCATRLCELAKGLVKRFDVYVCTAEGCERLTDAIDAHADEWLPEHFEAYKSTTRTALQESLAKQEFDLLHLLCHGVGVGVLLCDEKQKRDEVTSGELGEWCGKSRLQMAFLQVCKAGQSGDRGGFGGVAQQLLNPKYGNLAAVVASPYPVDAQKSTPAAIHFYQQLAEHKAPDTALDRSLEESDWTWAFLELWVRPGALSDTGSRGAFQFASPYRGLATFEERDAEIFFGRDAETAELVNILESEPVLAVVGDSGSGKSSLLHAGLVSCVRRRGLASLGSWRILSLHPGASPQNHVLGALASEGQDASSDDHSADSLSTDVSSADKQTSLLRKALENSCSPENPLLVIFDQFEEIFTLCGEEERIQLAETLAEFAEEHRDCFRLVLGMRSEFLGKTAALPGLCDRIARPWVLKPPGEDAVRAIVFQPADHHGYIFEGLVRDGSPSHLQGLLERIFDDLSVVLESTHSSAPLPLLEFALERLWLKAVGRGSRVFTHADYDALGGIQGAIAKHAESSYQQLTTRPEIVAVQDDNDLQQVAESIITGLIGAEGLRRPRNRDDLEAETGCPELAHEIIDYFVGERLLTIRNDPQDTGGSLADIAHEILIRSWDRLQSWLAENAEIRQLKEEFQNQAERWDHGSNNESPRSRTNLPGIHMQHRYWSWLRQKKPSLTETQFAFGQAIRRNLYKRRGIRVATVAISLLLALAMSGLAFLANKAEQRAGQERRYARLESLNAKMLYVQQVWGDRPDRALDVLESADVPEALRDFTWRYFHRLASMKTKSLRGHFSAVLRVFFSPDGKTLASCSFDGTVRLWDIETGRQRSVLSGHPRVAYTMAFSPDGTTLASVGEDYLIRIWSSATGDLLETLSGHTNTVVELLFSLDSNFLFSCSLDGTVRAWDRRIENGADTKVSQVLHSSDVPYNSAALSYDGKTLAAGDLQGVVRLWDWPSGNLKDERISQVGPIRELEFAYSHSWLVVISNDNDFEVWDTEKKEQMRYEETSTAFVERASFSPDDQWITFGQTPQKITSWNTSDWTTRELDAPIEIFAIAYSPDGKWLASSGFVNEITIWNVQDQKPYRRLRRYIEPFGEIDQTKVLPSALPENDNSQQEQQLETQFETRLEKTILDAQTHVGAAKFSPDNRWFVVGGDDGGLQIWTCEKELRWNLKNAHKDAIWDVAFSPDGKSVVTAGQDRSIRSWDIETGILRGGWTGAHGRIMALDYSADGETVAIGTHLGVVQLWNVRTAEVIDLKGHSRTVGTVAFSPDGSFLLSGSDDSTIRLWDLKTRRELKVFQEHRAECSGVVYASDGKTAFSCGYDGYVIIWDMEQRQLKRKSKISRSPLFQIACAHDDSTLATGGVDTVVRLLDPQTGNVRARLRGHQANIIAMDFSADGRFLATGAREKNILWWEAEAKPEP